MKPRFSGLCYRTELPKNGVQLPIFTSNSMLRVNPTHPPELHAHALHYPDKDLRKRVRYLCDGPVSMCEVYENNIVKRGGKQTSHPNGGDVVIVQDKNKNRNHWKIGTVTRLIKGRDEIVRGATLRTS